MNSILVISEEPALPETLASELRDATIVHARFSEASALLTKEQYRLILIDEGNKAALADTGSVPAIRLSRPIVLRDLLYTIQERLQGKTTTGREELSLSAGFKLCPSERQIRSDDGSIRIALTEKEMELLHSLLESAGEAVAKDILLKKVWGYGNDITTHTLETHIYRLRGKLRQASESLDIISPETGGYQLEV